MLYEAYQVHSDAFAPLRWLAGEARELLKHPWVAFNDHPMMRHAAATCEMITRVGTKHERPDFGINHVRLGGKLVEVREERAAETPFCTLTHFVKAAPIDQKRVLLVAPLSGHFATLLRGTVETLLPDHDVYVTDWINARNVPLKYGRFDLDDHIELMMDFMRQLGPDVHVIAVCQPSVPVLAAVSLMAQINDPAQPRTLTLMGGPIDTHANPTQVSRFAEAHSLTWLEHNVIHTVPMRHPGAFRRVYPGFLQLAGFLSMNLQRHVDAHRQLFRHLVDGDEESAAATRKFYDEYASVMDLPADFYLQTIDRVFHRRDLALGSFVSRSRLVEPEAIERTAVFLVEGENDDICAVGQTGAAARLLTGLPASKKQHYLQHGVGHYGVFNGSRWRKEIYPRIRAFIETHA